LLQLGATEIIERGLGDDQHAWGYHGALNPWLEKLWDTLLATLQFQLPPGFVVDDSPKMTAPRYSVEFLDDKSKTSSHDISCTFYVPPKNVLPSHNQQLVLAPVVRNERLTAADWTQDVRHIELDISHTSLTYAAGDTALIYPENIDKDGRISAFLTHLRLSRSSIVSIHRLDDKPDDIPSPCSIEDLMHKYLDVFGTPRRSFFERMSLFATDDEELFC
jgi:sulfite reductase alpha subunit-like flavoprotein